MPFIRHTRDKRGNETTYVMHAYRPAHGPQKTRVLYLFRSPSHLKMGRRALDEEIREALEHTHPDVSFDWSALGRESTTVREDPKARPRGARPGQAPGGRQPAPGPIEVVLEDQSVLGRVAGAERAARLRAQYGDLLQRIARRSRTPEDRDRLTQRAQRLNPDDWPDEDEVRAHLESIQTDWETIAADLPSRRRGRRGGRRRDREEGAGDAEPSMPDGPAGDVSSGIMAGGGNDLEIDFEGPAVDGVARRPGDGGDDGRLGAETGRDDLLEPADGNGLSGDD